MVMLVELVPVHVCLFGQLLVDSFHFICISHHLVDLLMAILDPVFGPQDLLLQLLDLVEVSLFLHLEVG